MDLLKNPFHILGATTRDNRHRIMELAEECSLLSDADECMEARSVLTHPRNRLSAEVAWLPGVDSSLYDKILRHLDSPSQNLFNITGLTHIARANLLISGLSRLPNLPSSKLVEWILTVAQASEAINSDLLRSTLNMDRRASSFPEITDLSAIEDEIRKQKNHHRQVITSVLENQLITEQARVLTMALEISTGNGRHQAPILIEHLILAYELSVQDSLEQKQKIIKAQDEKLRATVDAKNPDTTLQPIVNQLIQTVKEWDIIAQPIQLSKRSRGERHTASFEIAWRVRDLAIYLFNEYGKLDFSQQIMNMLKKVFAEVIEVDERITEDLKALENQVHITKSFENINTQVEKLKEASDARQSDYTLTPMVNKLIQSVKSWDTTQPVEANNAVAFTVRNIALHLCNEHQKLDFAIQITNALIGVFRGVYGMSEVNSSLNADIRTLSRIKSEQEQNRKSVEKFEEINAQAERLKAASDMEHPDYTLTPMVNKLIQSVKSWDTATQPIEANNAVAFTVRNIALHLCNEHQKLDFAIQITNALIGVFRGVYGMDEVNQKLSEDITTLTNISEQHRRQKQYRSEDRGLSGCLMDRIIGYAVIFGIGGLLVLIGGLMEGC